jgi:hypothetical protein
MSLYYRLLAAIPVVAALAMMGSVEGSVIIYLTSMENYI